MTNFTGSILNQTYDLTSLMTAGSDSAIDNPTLWLANWNIQMGNIGLITFLYVFTAILFFVMRRRPEVKDSEALLYAGLAGSAIGIILFVIEFVSLPGYKLVEWAALLPMIVITAGAIILNYINRNY